MQSNVQPIGTIMKGPSFRVGYGQIPLIHWDLVILRPHLRANFHVRC